MASLKQSRSHHLAKHSLASEVDVELHFGSSDPKEVAREIARLGQKQLQAKFNQLFSAKTYSNNNQWLRRKLLEAAGIQAPKAQGKSRSAPTRRSTSPVHASITSISASCEADFLDEQEHELEPACSPVKNVRPLSPASFAGRDALRRTKRQRRPRAFEDMLLLDSPTGPEVRPEDFFQRLDNPASTGVGKQGLQGMLPEHLYSPQQHGNWPLSGNATSPHLSGLSSQSSAGYPRLVDPALQLPAAFESPYRMKAHQLRLHQEALDDQLIRAGSIGSTSELLHNSPVGYRHATASMPPLQAGSPYARHAVLDRARSLQVSGLGDHTGLGAGCVRVPTPSPHNRLVQQRPVIKVNGGHQEQHLMQPKQTAVPANGLNGKPAPLLGREAAAAFADGLLDVELIGAEALRLPIYDHPAHLVQRPDGMPSTQMPASGLDDVKEAAADALLVDTTAAPATALPSASSLNSAAVFSGPQLRMPAAAAAASGQPSDQSSPPSTASTSPMDLIMLQELATGNMPMDSAALHCSNSTPDSVLSAECEPTPIHDLLIMDPLSSLADPV